jgi:hypothetical protein
VIKLADQPVKAGLVVLTAAVAVMLSAGFAAVANAAATPAALDQYSENAPPNLGHGGKQFQHNGGGDNGSGSEQGGVTALPPSASPPSAPAAIAELPNGSGKQAQAANLPPASERGSATLPILGYPLTPFLIVLLILLALALMFALARWLASRTRLADSHGHS